MAVLGLYGYVRLSLFAERGSYSLVVMRTQALHCNVFSFCGAMALGMWAAVVAALTLRSYGAWAWLLRGMRDLPRPGIESSSPALAGRFFTAEPPGKPVKNS